MSNVYAATSLTGGAAGALDLIDGTGLADKDSAIVFVQGGGIYFYVLDADSGAAESSPSVISPDANAGTKRWILHDVLTSSGGGYLKLAGGTMTGAIAMGSQKVTGLGAPSTNGDAVRATAKITEANLGSAVDLKHAAVTLEAGATSNILSLSTQELSVKAQNANLVLAGPASGAAAAPTFRALAADDIPSLSGIYLPLSGGTMTGNIVMPDGGTIGQAAGPLLKFDDSNNYLEITGCNVGIGTTTPGGKLCINGGLHVGGDSDPGDNNLLVDGRILASGQPMFKVGTATQSSVTGDGTGLDVPWSEITDQGGCFVTSTFTAPVAGKYQFNLTIQLQGITSAHSLAQIRMAINGYDHLVWLGNPYYMSFSGDLIVSGSVCTAMAASGTACVNVSVYNGTKVVDIGPNSYFSGFLIAA